MFNLRHPSAYYDNKGQKAPNILKGWTFSMNNNCLCNLFNDYWIWLIVIAIILIYCNCGSCGNTFGNGCGGCC